MQNWLDPRPTDVAPWTARSAVLNAAAWDVVRVLTAVCALIPGGCCCASRPLTGEGDAHERCP
jgi:hypothetical protein